MTLTLPKTMVAGTNENVNDVMSNDTYLATSVDSTNTAAGVSSASGWRGKSIIATEETRTNTAYGTLTTPDQVTGIVLPTSGLIRVFYQAVWQQSVDSAARAAIFIGSNQLKVANTPGSASPQLQSARTIVGAGPNIYLPLASFGMGLASSSTNGSDYADVTTGQAIGIADDAATVTNVRQDVGGVSYTAPPSGGPCYIFAAAGTYTISVQFKSSSGNVLVKNRKLWVAAEGF